MAYEIHLGQFDGPLDLLLHLIGQAKMDIREVQVSMVTAQYMQYMEQLDEIDMDSASEFLTMAATLLYIKSRTLLPKPQEVGEEQDAQDPEAVLLRQLREYQAFKQASELLEQLGEEGAGVFVKLKEEYPLPPPQINIIGMNLEDLYNAFTELLLRASMIEEKKPNREVKRDDFSVADRTIHIRQALKRRGRVSFFSLFTTCSKQEIVATFMALLELLANNEISLTQQQRFGEIIIEGVAV